jgi:MFS family permease
MQRNNSSIIAHNMRVFYFVDTFRAMFFTTTVWVAFERQFLSLSELMYIEALILGVQLTMQLPTGAFADIVGKKITMFIGMVVYFSAIMFYSISDKFPMFMIYAVLMGLAGSFIDGTREALLYDTLKQENKAETFPLVSSKLSLIFQIALAVSAIVGGIIGSYSYILTIRLCAVAFAIAAFCSLFYREPKIDTEKFTLVNYLSKTKQGVKELLKNSYIKKISLYYILVGSITWICVISINMIFLNELKFSPSEIGITLAVTRVLNMAILFGLLKYSNFFNRRRTFLMFPVIILLSYLPAVFTFKWIAVIPLMGSMFASSARWNLLSKFTNAEFTSKNRATALSALSMSIGIIYVFVVGISGSFMEHFGGARTIYIILGIVSAVTVLPLGLHLAKHHA